MISVGYLLITDHAEERFWRRCNENNLRQFSRFVRDKSCEIVYELVLNGNIDGYSRRYKFGSNMFALTFDTVRLKIVLKTIT